MCSYMAAMSSPGVVSAWPPDVITPDIVLVPALLSADATLASLLITL